MSQYKDVFVGSAKPKTNRDGDLIKTKNGGLLAVSINLAEHGADLKKASYKGWVTLTIGKRATPSEKGATHWVQVSYKIDEAEPPEPEDDRDFSGGNPDADDLPF